jgi:hypothetical protein
MDSSGEARSKTYLNAHGEVGVSDTCHKYQRSVFLTFLEGKGVYIPPLITN